MFEATTWSFICSTLSLSSSNISLHQFLNSISSKFSLVFATPPQGPTEVSLSVLFRFFRVFYRIFTEFSRFSRSGHLSQSQQNVFMLEDTARPFFWEILSGSFRVKARRVKMVIDWQLFHRPCGLAQDSPS